MGGEKPLIAPDEEVGDGRGVQRLLAFSFRAEPIPRQAHIHKASPGGEAGGVDPVGCMDMGSGICVGGAWAPWERQMGLVALLDFPQF